MGRLELCTVSGVNRRRSAASLELATEKVAEAGFFLAQLREARSESFEIRCLFSATVSAAYSALEALKAAAARDSTFSAWAATEADALRSDPVASYVLERRNESVHMARPVCALSGFRSETVCRRLNTGFASSQPPPSPSMYQWWSRPSTRLRASRPSWLRQSSGSLDTRGGGCWTPNDATRG